MLRLNLLYQCCNHYHYHLFPPLTTNTQQYCHYYRHFYLDYCSHYYVVYCSHYYVVYCSHYYLVHCSHYYLVYCYSYLYLLPWRGPQTAAYQALYLKPLQNTCPAFIMVALTKKIFYVSAVYHVQYKKHSVLLYTWIGVPRLGPLTLPGVVGLLLY